MHIIGQIHPPNPSGRRDDIDDMSSAEMAVTNMGYNTAVADHTTPVLVEHDGDAVGKVLTTWQSRKDGSLKMAARINDPETQRMVRSGEMRGLSIGCTLHQASGDSEGSERLMQTFDEVSVCKVPRRSGCFITAIDHHPVARTAKASAESEFPLSRE